MLKYEELFSCELEKKITAARQTATTFEDSLCMFNLLALPGLLFTFVICSVTTLFADFCYATFPPLARVARCLKGKMQGGPNRKLVRHSSSFFPSTEILPEKIHQYDLKVCTQSEQKYSCAADGIRYTEPTIRDYL